MSRLQRLLVLLLACVILIGAPCAAEDAAGTEEAPPYRTLKVGDKGDDVLLLKHRMYALGYFNTDKLSAEFNATTKARLQDLQKKNGLTADGIATPELQAFIFSGECLGKNDPVPGAAVEMAPGMPSPAGPNAPEAAADGYLPEGAEPYVYSNRDEGVWTYLSHDLHIEIRQYRESRHNWLVASIRVRYPELFTAMVNRSEKAAPGKNVTFLSMADTIAKKNGAVFAVSDDFFGYRLLHKQRVGVVIRNGIVWSEKTRAASSRNFPPLDVMAVFADGRMEAFESDAHTAQEYLDMGVVSTYAFGPILVKDGEICADLAKWNAKDRSPRMAMGMTEDGTIILLDAMGRRKDALGVTLPWMAEKMKTLGVVDALNLDGGNTTCMVFMGDIINRPAGVRRKDLRAVNSVIGVREADPEADTEAADEAS
ncbi:MAG: phosphodiester glycosidase family protein [Clostridia bacterium]|nr:phosphodiester glycosidase family protein [Clostridia bacterium]